MPDSQLATTGQSAHRPSFRAVATITLRKRRSLPQYAISELLEPARLLITNPASMSDLAIMHELTARRVISLMASEQMNLAGVREWTCRRKSDHWQAGHGSSRTSYITDEQYLRLLRALAH